MIRLLLAIKHMGSEIKKSLIPNAHFSLTYRGVGIPVNQVRAVFLVILLYALGYVVVGCLLTFTGLDLVTAFSAALACLGNIGPGFNSVGPMGNFSDLSPIAKLILTISMWVGRLEIVTIMALLHPLAWRDARWSDPDVIRRRIPKVRQHRKRIKEQKRK